MAVLRLSRRPHRHRYCCRWLMLVDVCVADFVVVIIINMIQKALRQLFHFGRKNRLRNTKIRNKKHCLFRIGRKISVEIEIEIATRLRMQL